MEKAGEEKSCEMGEQENDKDTTDTMELQMEGEKSVEAIVTDDPSASKSQPLQTETLNTQVRVGPGATLSLYIYIYIYIHTCICTDI